MKGGLRRAALGGKGGPQRCGVLAVEGIEENQKQNGGKKRLGIELNE